MSNSRRFLSRRSLLIFVSITALTFGLAMLHPYPRQSLFGPRIRGKPWCVWEGEMRYFVHHREYDQTFSANMLRWMGVKRDEKSRRELFGENDFLPLLLEMAEDSDRDVRAICLDSLSLYECHWHEAALPVLHRRLEDVDPHCRVAAAFAVWRINRDRRVVNAIKRELDDRHSRVRSKTSTLLDNVCADEPELFSIFLPYAKHPDNEVRYILVCAATRAPDKKGLAVLLDGLRDASSDVRLCAAGQLRYCPHRIESISALERSLKDKNQNVRRVAGQTLVAIDPQRFHYLKDSIQEFKID